MNMKTNKIFLIISLSVLAGANILPNKARREYAPLYINEKGTTILQENFKDPKNNLLISNVPAHNGRIHSVWIHDLGDSGLMMQVLESKQRCTIQSTFLNTADLANTFENIKSLEEEVSFEKPMDAMGPEVMTAKLQLVVSDEPMPHSLLPEKFQEHCPPTFKVFPAHTFDPARSTPDNPAMVKRNITHPNDVYDYVHPSWVAKERPRRQSDETYPCTLTDGSTSSQCGLDLCSDYKGNFLPKSQCEIVNTDCDFGCEVKDFRMDCWERGANDGACVYYILSDCKLADGSEKPQCVIHATTGDNRCSACCMNSQCEPQVPTCGPKN